MYCGRCQRAGLTLAERYLPGLINFISQFQEHRAARSPSGGRRGHRGLTPLPETSASSLVRSLQLLLLLTGDTNQRLHTAARLGLHPGLSSFREPIRAHCLLCADLTRLSQPPSRTARSPLAGR
ncbi:hypothetical protein AB1E18_003307 [Capra hircus]